MAGTGEEEFSRPEYVNQCPVPIILEGYSVKKDETKAKAGDDHEAAALSRAPNFATSLLGKWCARKLGLASPKPQTKEGDGEPSSLRDKNDYVLSNIYAVVKPGEGTLLLGPSSSGKTTLMRSIQEAIGGDADKMNIEGNLQVGKLDVLTNGNICKEKNLRRTTAFADQGDLSLTPVLTVEETIQFSRRCAEGNQDYMDESVLSILQMIGLDHVKDTVVGNADIRGISGGQKRRVKILEMFVGIDVNLALVDEPTNGLDSAGALVFAQVCSQMLKSTKSSSIISLLQPSLEVFQEFQRLILLTPDGKLVYSGKTDNVLSYFENTLGLVMPSTMIPPEFLLRCIFAPHEFRQEGGGGSDVPNVPLNCTDDWAKAFLESQAGKDLLEEIASIKTDLASQQIELPNLSEWAIPTRQQIQLLLDRSWKLVMRDPASILRAVMAVLFGLFIGTLFLNTPNDENGTFVRSGYVLTLLFITFLNSCLAPLEALFKDRNTFYIHRSGTLYRTTSYYMSQIITSAPVPLLEAFFLSLGSFFLVGMTSHQGGWGFFYFWLEMSLVALNGNAVSRILAYLLPTEDMANTLGPAALLFFVLTTGYSPRYLELPVWLRWLSWASPMAYVYEGIIQNEVLDRNVGNQKGSDYAAERFQIPRIPYDKAPPGMDSPGALMLFDVYMVLAITIMFEMCGCFLLHRSQNWYGPTTKRYQVASGMGLAAPPKWITNNKKRDTQRDLPPGVPRAPKAQLTAKGIVYEVDVPIVEDKRADKKEKEEGKGDLEQPKEEAKDGHALLSQEESHGIPITAGEYGQSNRGYLTEKLIKRRLGEDAINEESITFSVQASTASIRVELPPAEPGRLRLLSGISASFEPGTMTALMGSSGAGKSTLLDVLAGYKTGGHIAGEISINGTPKTEETWRAVAGYCEQVDLQNPSLTVHESLVFAARLRLRPFSIPDQDRVAFANNVLSLLELDEFADMLVGNEAAGEGLPKHARKRLTVGVELCANPSILFADEPTSGLDSLSASVVVASLERAAKQEGLTIVCTIHQPSRSVFEAFDNLLLLRKGGVCVYNGPISGIDNYLRSAPDGERFALPSGANPADHILDIFCGPGGEGVDWPELYEASDMVAKVKQGHEVDAAALGKIAADTTSQSFTSELYLEIQRELLVMWRTPQYMATRLWWTISASLIVGVMYLNTGQSGNVQNIIGAIFFFVNVSTVPLLGAMVPLVQARAVFYREISSGTYRRMVYGIAVQIAEMPFNLCFSMVSFLCFYFLVGLSLEGERIGYFILMALVSYWVLPTFGQLLAFLSPNLGVGVAFGSLLLTLFTLTMGFLIPANNIPPWYIWIYWLNPLRYILQGLVSNEIGGTPIGDDVLSDLQWDYDDRWFYCFFAIVLFGIAFSISILFATRISWLQR